MSDRYLPETNFYALENITNNNSRFFSTVQFGIDKFIASNKIQFFTISDVTDINCNYFLILIFQI